MAVLQIHIVPHTPKLMLLSLLHESLLTLIKHYGNENGIRAIVEKITYSNITGTENSECLMTEVKHGKSSRVLKSGFNKYVIPKATDKVSGLMSNSDKRK